MVVIEPSSLTQELRLLVLLDQREKSSIFSAELHAAFTPRDKMPATRPRNREPRIAYPKNDCRKSESSGERAVSVLRKRVNRDH